MNDSAILTHGYAVKSATSLLGPFQFSRRRPREHDVLIDIHYCGVCHSDIHQSRSEWGESIYPMVPGHEIVGRVVQVGAAVDRFQVGEWVGVGCFVDSCRNCEPCLQGFEQYCEVHHSSTYNGTEQDQKTPTYGGYSEHITVNQDFVLRLAPGQPFERVAPLLCAGITTYSPLKYWKAGPGQKIAVAGLGGLGHMAVKIAVALGAEVTVLSRSESKQADAFALGAHHFVLTADPNVWAALKFRFHTLIDLISADHDLSPYLNTLKLNGTHILCGVPERPAALSAANLIAHRRSLAGSLVGGLAETQEMLDFCARSKILADVEVIGMSQINAAYTRMLEGDVKYRFVIDLKREPLGAVV